MKATIRIVTPAAATVAAALLLTACADKPVRVPGGTFVEEPYQGETVTSSQPQQTTPSTGTETVETEGLYIEEEVPVGPVENEGQQTVVSGPQDTGSQLQPVEEDQQAAAKSNVPEGSVEYKVVKGDTLWGIGMVYGVPVARLAEINGLNEKAPLKIGQTLMIPPDAKNAVGKPIPQKKTEPAKTDAKADTKTDAKAAATTTTTKTSTATKTTPATKDGETLYVVKKGDSLSVIAQRHHVKLADLVAANKVDPKAILRVGQTLVIPAAGSKAASTTTKTDTKAATTTKTDAKADTKTDTKAAATTKTDTKAATTTTKTSSGASNAGEGSGGIVEPLGGGSFGGASSAPATTTPATTKPASSASSALPAVSGVDANVLPITTEFESTIEDLADYHDRKLEDMLRLNPQFKTGQKIPAGTIVNLPFM